MLFCPLILAALQSQIAPTVPSEFLAYKGAAYFPSPTYVVESASPDERFVWSGDGTRLAYVSDIALETPSLMEKRLATGQKPKTMTRLGIWSRETGRARELIQATDPTLGVDKFVFLGRDLVFSTFSETPQGSRHALWLARDGSPAKQIELPVDVGGAGLAVSRSGANLLVVTQERMWLLDANSTRPLNAPGMKNLLGRGTTVDDKGIVFCQDTAGEPTYLLVDLKTGLVNRVDKMPVPADAPKYQPFILDGYRLQGMKTDVFDNEDAGRVDSAWLAVLAEDGGYLADLVESEGARRRRIRFLNETANTVEISNDGMSFAFISNGLVMVRWMVKADAKTSGALLKG